MRTRAHGSIKSKPKPTTKSQHEVKNTWIKAVKVIGPFDNTGVWILPTTVHSLIKDKDKGRSKDNKTIIICSDAFNFNSTIKAKVAKKNCKGVLCVPRHMQL